MKTLTKVTVKEKADQLFRGLFPKGSLTKDDLQGIKRVLQDPWLATILHNPLLMREVQKVFLETVQARANSFTNVERSGSNRSKKEQFLDIALTYLPHLLFQEGDKILWGDQCYKIERVPLLSAKNDQSVDEKYRNAGWLGVNKSDRVYAYGLHPIDETEVVDASKNVRLVMPATLPPQSPGSWPTMWADILPFANIGDALFHKKNLGVFFEGITSRKVEVFGASLGGGLTQLLVNSKYANKIDKVTMFNGPGFTSMRGANKFVSQCETHNIHATIYANVSCPVHALGMLPSSYEEEDEKGSIKYFQLDLPEESKRIIPRVFRPMLRHMMSYAALSSAIEDISQQREENKVARHARTIGVLWMLRCVLFPVSLLLAVGVHAKRHPAISVPILLGIGIALTAVLGYVYRASKAVHFLLQMAVHSPAWFILPGLLFAAVGGICLAAYLCVRQKRHKIKKICMSTGKAISDTFRDQSSRSLSEFNNSESEPCVFFPNPSSLTCA